MAIISVAANASGATAKSQTITKVNAIYSGNITLPAETRPLMRVSPTYSKPTTLDAFGRPSTGQLTASTEVVEQWGKLAVSINGANVSFFRGAVTNISTVSWQRLGNFETAEIEIPSISIFETFGQGDLYWLTETGFLRIARVDADGSSTTLWLGVINGITPMNSNIGIKITAHGLLFDATYKVMKAPVRGSTSDLIEDLGYDISKSLNAIQGHWGVVQPVETGVVARKEASWETGLDYVKSLLSLAVTDAGNSWTVWVDSASRASLMRTANIPGNKTLTYIAGQDGVIDGLNIDTVSGVTTIYGQGTSRGGAAWSNLKFPNRGGTPRFPLDNIEESFGQGSTNASTASGTGISDLKSQLMILGRYDNLQDNFDSHLTDVVAKFQQDTGLAVTGSVDLATWERLFSVNEHAKDAYVAPLATVSAVQPRLYDSATGADIGPNPNYDPSIRPLEQHIDFGDGVSRYEAERAALAIINRDGSRPIEGSLTLTVCPQEYSRWDIHPGDKINLKGYRGNDVLLLVHRVEWTPNDETVKVDVSTRDMDYSELDAAMNRIRNANVGWTKSGGVTQPVSNSAGVAYTPIPVTPVTPSTTSSIVAGGSTITGVIHQASSFGVTVDYANKLVIIDPITACNITFMSGSTPWTEGDQVHFVVVNTSTYVPQFSYAANVHSFSGLKFAGDYSMATAVYLGDGHWSIAGQMRA